MPRGRAAILENTLSKLGEGARVSSFDGGYFSWDQVVEGGEAVWTRGIPQRSETCNSKQGNMSTVKYKKDKRCRTWSSATIKLSRHLWNLCTSNSPCCGTCEASASVVTWDGACNRRGFQPFWGAKSVYNSRWCFLMWPRRPVVDVLFEYW